MKKVQAKVFLQRTDCKFFTKTRTKAALQVEKTRTLENWMGGFPLPHLKLFYMFDFYRPGMGKEREGDL